MKYAINYRDMHTAMHGLILFDSKEDAESSLVILNEQKEEGVQSVFEYAHSVEDEINYRDIPEVITNFEYLINENGRVHPVINDITIINHDSAVDIY